MACLTTYLQNKILAMLFNGVSYTPPTTCYIGLCTSVNAAGTITGEPVGDGYQRVAIAVNGTTVFGSPSNGQIANGAAAINFPADVTANWGTLGYWFIIDAATGGNVLVYGTTSGNTTVAVGQQPYFPVSQVTINGSAW